MTIEPSGLAGHHTAYAGARYPDTAYPVGTYQPVEPPTSAYAAPASPAVPYQPASYSDAPYADPLTGPQPTGGYPVPGQQRDHDALGYGALDRDARAYGAPAADANYSSTVYTDSVHVYEWQFYLLDGEQAGFPWRENTNGLVALSSGIAVFTGTGNGRVPVTVQVCDAPPPVDYAAWDEIVEVSYYTARGDARVCSWQREPAPGIPVVSRYGPGTYRVRAHAKGRDMSRDALRVLADEYCFAIWPAPGEATTIHKTTDDVGRVLRAGFSHSYHYR